MINRADEMPYEATLQGRDRLVTMAADPSAPIIPRSTAGKRSGRPPARQRTAREIRASDNRPLRPYASQARRVCSENDRKPAYLADHLAYRLR
jgi:hypothetical protein